MSDTGDLDENGVHRAITVIEEEGGKEEKRLVNDEEEEEEILNGIAGVANDDSEPVDKPVEGDADADGDGNGDAAQSDEVPPETDVREGNPAQVEGEAEGEVEPEPEPEASIEVDGSTDAQPGGVIDDDEEGFDPATLANLAALSRIVNDDEDEEVEDEDQEGRDKLILVFVVVSSESNAEAIATDLED